jgi:hypothetical protein
MSVLFRLVALQDVSLKMYNLEGQRIFKFCKGPCFSLPLNELEFFQEILFKATNEGLNKLVFFTMSFKVMSNYNPKQGGALGKHKTFLYLILVADLRIQN